jgi:hypothetical protein
MVTQHFTHSGDKVIRIDPITFTKQTPAKVLRARIWSHNSRLSKDGHRPKRRLFLEDTLLTIHV